MATQNDSEPPPTRSLWKRILHMLRLHGWGRRAPPQMQQITERPLSRGLVASDHVPFVSPSEQHKRIQQLEAQNRELLARLLRLRRMLENRSLQIGVAAHDLKTPLIGIHALTELLHDRQDLPDDVQRKLSLIYTSTDEALTLVDVVLQNAAHSIQRALEDQPIDMCALCRSLMREMAAPFARKTIHLRYNAPRESCFVLGDKGRVREALRNLLSNALKYSPHGTSVTVTVATTDDTVTVSVSDEGPGLSAEDQDRLFDPFQRLTPTPTGGESSSGMGLYIVKQIADAHDATIQVDASLGEGSTFALAFPIYIVPDEDPVRS